MMLRVKDVDALCAQALAHGARLLHPAETHVYGERQATLEDFAGQSGHSPSQSRISTLRFGAGKP
jgi:uncharacterized glyoxalase superfamily protein PhnB